MSLRCLFGHDREYGTATVPFICGHVSHSASRIEVRWACRRCSAMGSVCLPAAGGAYRIHFGRLEPDKKAWLAGLLGVTNGTADR